MGSSSSVVSRLRLVASSYERAVDSYFDGDFDFSIEALQNSASPRDWALLARCLIRSGRLAEAAEFSASVLERPDFLATPQRAELLLHRAHAIARLRASADQAFMEARAFVFSAGITALEAELSHAEAFAHLMNGAFEKAGESAKMILELRCRPEEPINLVPLEHTRARAYDVLAFLEAKSERFQDQKFYARAALNECDLSSVRDHFLEAHLLWNLSIFSREFGDDGYVRDRFQRMPHNSALLRQRYEILRSLAWSNALKGDYLGTFRDLRDASDIAPTIPQKIQATLDRSYFARELNQIISAREELDFADRMSCRVDWDAAASEDGALQALIHLSEAISAINPERARRLFDRFKALKPKLPSNFISSFDRRARAEELVADATISNSEGNRSRAISLFFDAFEIWDCLGYGVRAAMVARELGALGAGERFAEYAAKEASLRPRSWLSSSLANRPSLSTLN